MTSAVDAAVVDAGETGSRPEQAKATAAGGSTPAAASESASAVLSDSMRRAASPHDHQRQSSPSGMNSQGRSGAAAARCASRAGREGTPLRAGEGIAAVASPPSAPASQGAATQA